MKITIPFNVFIFLWSILGIVGLGYSYADDLLNGINLFNSRSFYSQLFWFLFCLLYAVNYVKHKFKNAGDLDLMKN
ncbi:hypothetical protein [Daejeonella oryzae]|uniref:hypothetical protein n=1 Tax=Daejeonella oryzae TaxID=1122943 RepID=UPI0003F74BD2|nr:hypothetical protein [Daejeonella oryzae]